METTVQERPVYKAPEPLGVTDSPLHHTDIATVKYSIKELIVSMEIEYLKLSGEGDEIGAGIIRKRIESLLDLYKKLDKDPSKQRRDNPSVLAKGFKAA